MPTLIRVVVADDHPSVRENLRYLLNAEGDITVVAVAKDGAEAVAAVHAFAPDVLVTDSDMPHLDGIDLVLRLRHERPAVRVVIFTADTDVCRAALEAGATACVGKDIPSQVLVDAIRVAWSSGRRTTLPS